MSTIRADNYQDRSGNNLAKIRAYAYLNVQTGSVSIRKQFGISGVTDNGVGDYTLNFSPALPTSDYVMVSSSAQRTGLTAHVLNTRQHSQTTTQKRFFVQYTADLTGGALFVDMDDVQVAIISDL